MVGKPNVEDEEECAKLQPFSGQWVTENGATKKLGRPTTRGHRFKGEATSEGAREGEGIELFPNGNRYVGSFADDHREGAGTLSFASGSVYQGSFANGLPAGEGTLTAHTGAVSAQGAGGRARRHRDTRIGCARSAPPPPHRVPRISRVIAEGAVPHLP